MARRERVRVLLHSKSFIAGAIIVGFFVFCAIFGSLVVLQDPYASDPLNQLQSPSANYTFTSGNSLVDQNANELWSVLVCKPWLIGEFGTANYTPVGQKGPQTIVNQYGRQLLFAQAVAADEKPTATLDSKRIAVLGR